MTPSLYCTRLAQKVIKLLVTLHSVSLFITRITQRSLVSFCSATNTVTQHVACCYTGLLIFCNLLLRIVGLSEIFDIFKVNVCPSPGKVTVSLFDLLKHPACMTENAGKITDRPTSSSPDSRSGSRGGPADPDHPFHCWLIKPRLLMRGFTLGIKQFLCVTIVSTF